MTFDKLHRIILETSFADLPDSLSRHYGFWISPDGEVELVPNGTDHAVVAKLLIQKNPYLMGKFKKMLIRQQYDISKIKEVYYMTFKDFLYEQLHYMRVMKDQYSLYSSVVGHPTNKQKETLKDLGMLYDMQTMTIEEE